MILVRSIAKGCMQLFALCSEDNEASDGSYGVFSEYDVWEIYLAGFRSGIFPKTFEWKSFCCALSSPNSNLRNTRAEYKRPGAG